jgi:3-keto-disaccharide hydrolase
MLVNQRARAALFLVFGTSVLGCASSPSVAQQPAPARESVVAAAAAPVGRVPDGWENLLPPVSLDGFKRVPLDPLADKSVWQVRADGSLFIDGLGAKEMLLSERELGDGSLHVEWRFLASESAVPTSAGQTGTGATGAAPMYNGGVYVRTPLDGKTWVQLQVALADKPPIVGDLIAQVPGRSERVDVFQTGPSAAAPIGEWNTYDVNLMGPSIELTVNGEPAARWAACPMLTGHVGLQAEGSPIEVRAFRYRAL